jgi:hypothetical protein
MTENDRAQHSFNFEVEFFTKENTGALDAVVEHWQHCAPAAISNRLVLEAANVQLQNLGL